jgi:enoyl-CoA hydratase/carnithine racemase
LAGSKVRGILACAGLLPRLARELPQEEPGMSTRKDERANARRVEQQLAFVPRPRLEEYRAKYADLFALERKEGILHVQMHTDSGSTVYGQRLHNAWSQLWLDVGNDPDNEVMIFSGAGDKWIGAVDPSFPPPDETARALQSLPADAFYDHVYSDATKILESFIFNIDIPTIACINGPGIHTEFGLLCDITLAAQHAELFDPHYQVGLVPGDGQGLVFQELLGPKRAAYYLYTCEPLTAQAAKDLGLVNEAVPLDRLLPRAFELANLIMQQPRHVRRFTSAVVRRQWKRRLVQDLGFHMAHELLAIRLHEQKGRQA